MSRDRERQQERMREAVQRKEEAARAQAEEDSLDSRERPQEAVDPREKSFRAPEENRRQVESVIEGAGPHPYPLCELWVHARTAEDLRGNHKHRALVGIEVNIRRPLAFKLDDHAVV